MYENELAESIERRYQDAGKIHTVKYAPAIEEARRLYESYRGGPSFTAIVRIIETLGLVEDPVRSYGFLHTGLVVHVEKISQLFGLSERILLGAMLDEGLIYNHYWTELCDAVGVFFFGYTSHVTDVLAVVREAVARALMYKHSGYQAVLYTSTAPPTQVFRLKRRDYLATRAMFSAQKTYLELLVAEDQLLYTVLKREFMRMYPELRCALRWLA
jgi:hypothetical protein